METNRISTLQCVSGECTLNYICEKVAERFSNFKTAYKFWKKKFLHYRYVFNGLYGFKRKYVFLKLFPEQFKYKTI